MNAEPASFTKLMFSYEHEEWAEWAAHLTSFDDLAGLEAHPCGPPPLHQHLIHMRI